MGRGPKSGVGEQGNSCSLMIENVIETRGGGGGGRASREAARGGSSGR